MARVLLYCRAMDAKVEDVARQHGLDPILAVVSAAAVEGKDRTVAFKPDGLKRIQAALDARRARSDLVGALTALVAFAAYLDRDCRSPKAAADLVAIALTALDALEARLAQVRAQLAPGDEARRKTEQLAAFLGEARRASAPRVDGKKPPGTVGLNQLFKPGKITGR